MTNNEKIIFKKKILFKKVPKTHFLGPKYPFLSLWKQQKTTIKSEVKLKVRKK